MNPGLQNWRNVAPAERPEVDDDFLSRWLDEARAAAVSITQRADALDAVGRNLLAESNGFRSWRQMAEFLRHTISVRERFVHETPFRQLWSRLKLVDKELGEAWYFGEHHGGVPGRLLQAVEYWHQVPKFTAAERKRHGARIGALCTDLEIELSKAVPGGVTERDLDGFWLTPDQVQALMRALRTPEVTAKGIADRPDLAATVGRYALETASITPMWAVRAIRDSAAKWSNRNSGLPRKVRSSGAMKTYFINVLESAINIHPGAVPPAMWVGDQLRADLVGLLADVDCSADDVRKATQARRTGYRPED